jgi:hypothetical protein
MKGFRGLAGLSVIATALSCGGRTGLPIVDERAAELPDAGAVRDGAPDSPMDAPLPQPDAIPAGCDAGAQFVLLLSAEREIYRFDPLTLAVERLASVGCHPNLTSMTVARSGIAYVSSSDGQLFSVVPESGECAALPFDSSQLSFTRFGMGFVADDVPRGESLFIAQQLTEAHNISVIDLDSFELRLIGQFDPPLPPLELTGSGDGRMFGFHVASATAPARLIEIDKQTAALGAGVEIPIGESYRGFDFAFWGGDFYLFVTLVGELDAAVLRYSPVESSVVTLGRIPPIVIGAGVSTCAPL